MWNQGHELKKLLDEAFPLHYAWIHTRVGESQRGVGGTLVRLSGIKEVMSHQIRKDFFALFNRHFDQICSRNLPRSPTWGFEANLDLPHNVGKGAGISTDQDMRYQRGYESPDLRGRFDQICGRNLSPRPTWGRASRQISSATWGWHLTRSERTFFGQVTRYQEGYESPDLRGQQRHLINRHFAQICGRNLPPSPTWGFGANFDLPHNVGYGAGISRGLRGLLLVRL